MSIPKNHHYVTECHIEYFKNSETGKYFLYNKELRIFEKPKLSANSIFSEDYSNTRFRDGELDHKGLEDELNISFETDFPKHAKKIIEFVKNQPQSTDSIEPSLRYLVRYAIIYDMRHPNFKKQIDDQHNNLMSQVINTIYYLENGGKSNYKITDFVPLKTKYSNVVGYNEVADIRLELIGDLSIDIVEAEDGSNFILPDTGCYLKRARINNHLNRNIKDIAVIGLPLTDKIFILARSTKLKDVKKGIFLSKNCPSILVEDANRELYLNAIKSVLSSNKDLLSSIVSKLKD